jgi:hypothetical protein
MGNKKQPPVSSRRKFFTSIINAADKKHSGEMVKMLTPDGNLVEVEKSFLEMATKNKKATNQEIFEWMKNPSKADQ